MSDRDDHARRSRLVPWMVLAAIVAMAVLMRADFVNVGLMGDDYAQREMIAGHYAGPREPWDLFRFVAPEAAEFDRHREVGSLPWWSSPTLRGSMFRPLASMSIWLDEAIAPRDWRAHHLHSLAWWAMTVLAAGLALRRTLGRWLGLVALGLFAVDPSAVLSVAWLANRGILQSATFGFLALFFHLGPPSRHRVILTAGALTLSLLSGEYGLAACGYVIAHVWLVERSRSGGGVTPMLRRTAAYAAPALAYLIGHRLLGHGNNSGSLYVDPLATPARFVGAMADRLPRLLGDLWLSTPASSIDLRLAIDRVAPGRLDSALAFDDFVVGHAVGASIAVLCGLLVAWQARHALEAEERRTVRWLVLGSLVGVLPLVGAPPHTRLLLLASLGSSAVAAVAIAATVRAFRDRNVPRPGAVAIGGLGLVLMATQGIADPLRAGSASEAHRAAACAVHEAMGPLLRSGSDLEGRDVVLISSHQQTASFDGVAYMRHHGHPVPRSWQTLCWAQFPIAVARTGPSTLELTALADGHWLATPWERGHRPHDEDLARGDTLVSGALTYTIIDVDDLGPTKVRFDFDGPIDDTAWFVSGPDGLRKFALPEVGRTAVAPLARAPIGDPECEIPAVNRVRPP